MDMGKKLFNLLLVEFALVLAGSQAGQCQSDTYLIGAVTDNETKNPVTGANITVVGMHYGTVSDSTGRFVIQGPPIGSRMVKVSHVGYATKYCSATIDSGRTIFLNVLLSGAAIALPAGVDTYLIGAVTDNGTKAPVTDANITVVGTHYGTVSDSTGRFVIQGPPIGSRMVKVSHVGYATKYCSATINSGRTIFLNVLLSEAAITLPAVTVLGEHFLGDHMLDDFYRMSASANVTAKDIQDNGFIDFEGIFLRYAYFMSNDDYALFVNGIRSDPEILETINVRDVKEVFIWRWALAPVELKERLGTTEIDSKPNGGFEVHWSELHYVVLVNTR
jgi:hypothetical protein